MKVPTRDLRIGVQYLHVGQGRIVTDMASANAGLHGLRLMMLNVQENGHKNPTFVRLAVRPDETGEIHLQISCEYCERGSGLMALAIAVYADADGNEHYACRTCGDFRYLTKVN